LGFSGTNSPGSSEVGFTVSEILVPADVKKLLNSSAIDVLIVVVQPLTWIKSILFGWFLVLIASFRICHVFLGF
jgi:hypothetical protein